MFGNTNFLIDTTRSRDEKGNDPKHCICCVPNSSSKVSLALCLCSFTSTFTAVCGRETKEACRTIIQTGHSSVQLTTDPTTLDTFPN